MAAKVIFLTSVSANPWVPPADFPGTADNIEGIGAAGDGGFLASGGGGAGSGGYAKRTNVSISGSMTFQIGVHNGTIGTGTGPTANTWAKDVSTLVAPGGQSGSGATAGLGGKLTDCVGSTKFAGANGGNGTGQFDGGSGAGAAGPNGAGGSPPNGGGFSGGTADNGTVAGGTAHGGAGLSGAEWTSNPGGVTAGSGSGGAGNTDATAAGAGGLYGGAGAGGGSATSIGLGQNGFIVITYTPVDVPEGHVMFSVRQGWRF